MESILALRVWDLLLKYRVTKCTVSNGTREDWRFFALFRPIIPPLQFLRGKIIFKYNYTITLYFTLSFLSTGPE